MNYDVNISTPPLATFLVNSNMAYNFRISRMDEPKSIKIHLLSKHIYYLYRYDMDVFLLNENIHYDKRLQAQYLDDLDVSYDGGLFMYFSPFSMSNDFMSEILRQVEKYVKKGGESMFNVYRFNKITERGQIDGVVFPDIDRYTAVEAHGTTKENGACDMVIVRGGNM